MLLTRFAFLFSFVILASALNIEDKCQSCRDFIAKFKEKMDETSRANFGGGDVAWQEEKLGSFAKSETRLLEILDKEVCKSARTESYCHSMVEEYEEEIEHWWFKIHGPIPEYENYLCVDTAKVCCPSGKYGKKCTDCPSVDGKPCNGHGTCKGNGTRGGSGKCDCESAYNGTKCDSCNSGYKHDDSGSCEDLNECLLEEGGDCADDEYCSNNVGSFSCETCDEACETCKSKTVCTSCKEGYRLNEDSGSCADINECEETDNLCDSPLVCVNQNGTYKCAKPGPDGYTLGKNEVYYKLHETKVNWTVAMETCVTEGAHLVTIESTADSSEISSQYPSPRMWIDLSDAKEEGVWRTSQMGPTNRVNATELSGEPNGAEEANCVVTNWNEPGRWNDEDCSAEYAFLCQADASDSHDSHDEL